MSGENRENILITESRGPKGIHENISMISIRIFVEWWNLLNRWRCRNEGRICVIVTSKESPTVQILNCTEFRCHSPRVDQIEEGVLLFRSLTIRCWFARDANFNLKANPRCKLCGSFCGGRRESLTLSFLCSLLFPCYLIKSFSSENWVPLTSLFAQLGSHRKALYFNLIFPISFQTRKNLVNAIGNKASEGT